MEVMELVNKLGSNLKPGSSALMGVPYQNLPGLEIPAHRPQSEMRANRIAELVPLNGKTVLDLGCNVGTISAQLAKYGATVTGVDYDEASLEVAKAINGTAAYQLADINLDFLKKLPDYDVIVWLSQFQWLVKQRGMDYALDCLWEIGRHCKTLVFETAGKDDGSAPLDYNQEDILRILCKNTIFTDIRDCGQWNDLWTPRNVFVCKDPLIYQDGLFARLQTGERGTITKSYKDFAFAKEIKGRVVLFLKMLSGTPFFPKLLEQTEDSITISWEGPKATFLPENDLRGILGALENSRICHRDIHPDNLLFNGKNVVLIDFAFASFPGEVMRLSHDMGGKYKWPHGFSDEYSLRKVQQELLK